MSSMTCLAANHPLWLEERKFLTWSIVQRLGWELEIDWVWDWVENAVGLS
jgi:hypothetical protein